MPEIAPIAAQFYGKADNSVLLHHTGSRVLRAGGDGAGGKLGLKHLAILDEFRELMSELEAQVEASSAMGHFDIHKVSEGLVLGVLRELYGWEKLRNLNADERPNFPGIDLADDEKRIAIQVTSTPTLEKVKATIETFLSHGLDKRYQRLMVYVLTRKQTS